MFTAIVVCLCVSQMYSLSVLAGLSAEFETQLQQAEAAQEERREPLVGLESWIVEVSPKTRLANGDGDISTIGKAERRPGSCSSDLAALTQQLACMCRRLRR